MRKHVITGGPCAGKTTVIDELRRKGFKVLEEVAREVIDKRKEFAMDDEEIAIRQTLMFNKQLDMEKMFDDMDSQEHLFLDRGLGDMVAYSVQLIGYIPKEIKDKEKIIHGRYELIFVLDRLPFVKDDLRVENSDEEAQQLHDVLARTYSSYGYTIVRVPLMPVQERADFILNYIKNEKIVKGGFDKNGRML